MNVSGEMFKIARAAFGAAFGTDSGIRAAIAVLPEMYTVEQVRDAMRPCCSALQVNTVRTFLTQQTPAAPEVQNDVKPSYVATPSPYVSSFTTSEMKYPNAWRSLQHTWEPDFSEGEPSKNNPTCGVCGSKVATKYCVRAAQATPTITMSHGAMTGCTQDAIDQATAAQECQHLHPIRRKDVGKEWEYICGDCGTLIDHPSLHATPQPSPRQFIPMTTLNRIPAQATQDVEPYTWANAEHLDGKGLADKLASAGLAGYAGIVQATPDAEPCGFVIEGRVSPPVVCDRIKAHDGEHHASAIYKYPPEPTITLAEHKAKMREAIYKALKLTPDYKDALFSDYGLIDTEPTPEERVTVDVVHGNAAVYYVDGKVATDRQIKAALIAQLEKESK